MDIQKCSVLIEILCLSCLHAFCNDKRLRLQVCCHSNGDCNRFEQQFHIDCAKKKKKKIKPNLIRIASPGDHSIIAEYSDYLVICPSSSDMVTYNNYPIA